MTDKADQLQVVELTPGLITAAAANELLDRTPDAGMPTDDEVVSFCEEKGREGLLALTRQYVNDCIDFRAESTETSYGGDSAWSFLEGEVTKAITDAGMARRCRRLALSLIELGEDRDGTRKQLELWHFDPALATAATDWAWDRHRGGS